MDREEFAQLLRSGIEELISKRGKYTVQESGIHWVIEFRPKLSWELREEHIRIQLEPHWNCSNDLSLKMEFVDPEVNAATWAKKFSIGVAQLSTYKVWHKFNGKWRGFNKKIAVDILDGLANELVFMARAIDCVNDSRGSNPVAEFHYLLAKWIDRRDDYLLKLLIRRYRDGWPLLVKVSRLMGMDVSAVLKNVEASDELE